MSLSAIKYNYDVVEYLYQK